MTDRLQRFRQYIERLDAAADPRFTIERGFYVPPSARSVADEVAGRLELQPASAHLIAGGIGSGTTTQLLMAAQRLRMLPDMQAIYMDVSASHDLGKLREGVLIALAGVALTKLLKNDGNVVVDQSLVSPERSALKTLTEALRGRVPHITLLVDSLDRVADMDQFEAIVREDVAFLRALGIGVVLVGPLKLLYGTWRPIAAPFDKLHQVSWVDPEEASGKDFLLRVLRARSPEKLLSDEGAARLVEFSGGVLRDLIGLARDAGEEAYLAGDETISQAHADAAADAFGRTLVLGLVGDDLATLQRVRAQGSFVPVSDRDLALLMTGRVLEYRNGRTRYALHPTIRPLLEQLAAAP